MKRFVILLLLLSGSAFIQAADTNSAAWQKFLSGKFEWIVSEPLVAPIERPTDPCISVKDPSIVRFEGNWHLFCTIRSQKRSHQIEYLTFTDWAEPNKAPRHVLQITNNYFCAPQVFYFTPHKKWYLIYQASEETRKPSLQPAFSVTDKLDDPLSWTRPKFLYERHPENVKSWIDFWVICDESKAHLFFTSNDGRMWRAETRLSEFPLGWGQPEIVLRDDIFEASHTYRLKGANKFLTIVEAEGAGGIRYYKAYIADRLDGEWKPLAATKEKPFASAANIRFNGAAWTDSISHGELLREGYDEHMVVDPTRLELLFQGVLDKDRAGKKYGEIPWRLGLLEPVSGP